MFSDHSKHTWPSSAPWSSPCWPLDRQQPSASPCPSSLPSPLPDLSGCLSSSWTFLTDCEELQSEMEKCVKSTEEKLFCSCEKSVSTIAVTNNQILRLLFQSGWRMLSSTFQSSVATRNWIISLHFNVQFFLFSF